MQKKTLFITGIILAIVLVVGLIIIFNGKNKTETNFKTTEDIVQMMNTIKKVDTLPDLETHELNLNELDSVKSYTGLKSTDLIDSVVVNEPAMGSQAYSVLAINVKNINDVESIKQEIFDNINMNKWLCVSADKLVITNTNNLIFVVMTSNDWFEDSYNAYKKYVNNEIGKELEKEAEEIELPPEVIQ